MKRKLFAGVLSLVFLCISFAGCSGSTNASGVGGTTAGLTYNDVDVSEHVELVMYYVGDSFPDEQRVIGEINKILKEKINTTIVTKNMSLSDYQTKYSLTIAGGEKLDLIYTSNWAYYQSEATKGAFAELTTEILEKCMPLTNENQDPVSFSQAKIQGKAYFVPVNMANVNANAIVIRGDLREKYGLPKIETAEDLSNYYAAIAEDNNSDISFAYDAAQNNDMLRLVEFFAKNNFVQIAGAIQDYFTYEYSEDMDINDLFWIYDSPEYLEYAKTMKEWADKGYWSKSAVANATDVKESFGNGKSASYVQNLGTVGAAASAMMDAHPEWKPEIVDITSESDRFLASYTGDGYAVLANSQNQERAFMTMDLLKYNEELYYLVRHGIEGVHYERSGDKYWVKGPEFDNWPFGNAFSWGIKNSMFELTREDTFSDQKEIGAIWTARAVASPTASFAFDDTNIQNELANLKSVYTQYVPLLDLGLVPDVEATLAEFAEKAKAAGLEKIQEEVKAQIEEHLKNM